MNRLDWEEQRGVSQTCLDLVWFRALEAGHRSVQNLIITNWPFFCSNLFQVLTRTRSLQDFSIWNMIPIRKPNEFILLFTSLEPFDRQMTTCLDKTWDRRYGLIYTGKFNVNGSVQKSIQCLNLTNRTWNKILHN
jgi:hypothetical protein